MLETAGLTWPVGFSVISSISAMSPIATKTASCLTCPLSVTSNSDTAIALGFMIAVAALGVGIIAILFKRIWAN
ncbi:hypothetical protein [Mesorhizobium sp. IMUNJ 23232]|uniref:hypothetical protein n=1 Tax=Mesorhizobium sp. IMUNJ 23232 TaxID=3376064 RepID=UPI0037B397DF